MKQQVSGNPAKNRGNQYDLMIVACMMVTLYLIANIMAVRIVRIGELSLFDAGTLTFPFAYMLGDTLTEVWGLKIAKKVIYITFVCNIILVFFTGIGVFLPYPEYQIDIVNAYNTIFTYVPRIVAASLIAFLAGEVTNAYSFEVIRKFTGEKHLWVRTIGSSAVGYIFDTVLFVLIAFVGVAPAEDIIYMIIVQYIAKLVIEAIAGTPFAYALVAWLQKVRKHERS